MALTRKEKVKLFKEYDNLVENNRTMIVVSYNAIPVNTIVKMRKEFKEKVVVYKVVKKRVFVKVLEERGYDVDLGNLEGSVAILFSNDEGINGLKIIEKYKKEWKKNKLKSSVEYLGGWFDKEWRGADYVKVLSQIPSKEELVWKFLYMVKYPIQGFVTVNKNLISWFVRVLDQIKEKK